MPICDCLNCVEEVPGGKPVSQSTLRRHKTSQLRKKSVRILCMCLHYPSGHYFHSRRPYAYHCRILRLQQRNLLSSDSNPSHNFLLDNQLLLNAEDKCSQSSNNSSDSETSDNGPNEDNNINNESSEESDNDDEDAFISHQMMNAMMEESNEHLEDISNVLDVDSGSLLFFLVFYVCRLTLFIDDENTNDLKLFFALAEWSQGISRVKYHDLQLILKNYGLGLPSLHRMRQRLQKITKIEPRFIHCCYNNCIAFTG